MHCVNISNCLIKNLSETDNQGQTTVFCKHAAIPSMRTNDAPSCTSLDTRYTVAYHPACKQPLSLFPCRRGLPALPALHREIRHQIPLRHPRLRADDQSCAFAADPATLRQCGHADEEPRATLCSTTSGLRKKCCRCCANRLRRIYKKRDLSPDAKPRNGAPISLPSAITLKSSPISAGLVSFCSWLDCGR